jgi:predicted metal-dependent phosphoesterase TrpH
LIIDLHTHTFPSSDDSFMSPDELVETSKGLELDGVCITDHDHFWDLEDIHSLSKRHNFLVLPGCEVNTDGGHALVFGLGKYVFGMHKIAFLRQRVDEAGGAIVAAHPYRRRFLRERADHSEDYRSMVEKACADQFFSFCDAIEVLNGRATEEDTEFSLELSRKVCPGMVGGSDSHRVSHLGSVATMFHKKISCLDDLVLEIRGGRMEPLVLDGSRAPYARAGFASASNGSFK